MTRYLTITSMAIPQQQNPHFQEGRLILAIDAYNKGQFQSLWAATSMYNVPRTTARQYNKGIKAKRGFIALNRRLTLVQEESLKQ